MPQRSIPAIVESFKPPPTWFAQWWNPHDFLAEVQTHAEPVPRALLFNHPDLKQLREALAAAKYAALRSNHTSLQIRLELGRFPDFQICTSLQIEPFELVEADRAGRRRGEEYRIAEEREAAGLPPEPELFDPIEERQTAIEAIVRAVEGKAAKNYRPSPNLLVYVNFLIFEKMSFSFSESHRLVDVCRDRFPAVWLLWGGDVGQLWPRLLRVKKRKSEAVGSNGEN